MPQPCKWVLSTFEYLIVPQSDYVEAGLLAAWDHFAQRDWLAHGISPIHPPEAKADPL